MTLEADTKLVENALESMKLNGVKGVDSPRVRRNEEQTAQIENSEKTHIIGVDFALWRRGSRQTSPCSFLGGIRRLSTNFKCKRKWKECGRKCVKLKGNMCARDVTC